MVTMLLALILTGSPEFEVQPLEGQRLTGRIVGLDAKQLTLALSAGRVSLETDKVAFLAAKQKPGAPRPEPAVWVDLVEGSVLTAEEYTARDGHALITLIGGEVLDLTTREIASVRFQAGPETMAAEWSRIVGMKLQNDLLVTTKGDGMDYHKGVLHEVTEKQVRFDFDGEVLGVKRSKVYGLIYYHAAESETPAGTCTILDASGSRWSARAVSLSGDKLQWNMSGGRTMRRGLDQIAEIDLSRGKIVFLSDLKSDLAAYTPFFGLEKEPASRLELFRPRQDQNLESKPLQIGGKQFPKGLSLHSRTEIVYRLPGHFSRFEAIAGIDDSVRPRGHVRLVVRGDDKVLLEAKLAGADPPRPIAVDVTSVGRLSILVDFGDDLDVSDHLDLGNARFIK